MLSYHLFALLLILIISLFIVKRKQWRASILAGSVAWGSLLLYFPIEALAISRTKAPYDVLTMPMSDLGVTACGMNTYMLAPYPICSPLFSMMNITFILTGIMIAAGAILLHNCWPDGTRTRLATILWVIYGIGYMVSGIYPADIHFWVHVAASLPSMVVHIPAMFLLDRALGRRKPELRHWTTICIMLTAASLLGMFLGVAPGLMQRLMYGSTWLWMGVMAVGTYQGSVK